jgi:beta-lactamase class D
MRTLCALFLLTLLTPSWAGPPGVFDPQELSRAGDEVWLDGRQLVFYAEDLATGERYAYQRDRIKERHPPFSSFKIPNLLIALETGAATGLDHRIAYEPARRPAESHWPEDWRQEQTLETAFKRSAAWYFQDLALAIGPDAYRGYLGHFGYGQGASNSDAFWLDRSLVVSPKEQASFLRRLLIGQLEVSPNNIALLAQVSRAKSFGDLVLHGKTGAGPVTPGRFDGPFEGWYVGWLHRPSGKPVVFATWVAAPGFESLKDFRQQAAETMLQRMGMIP